jgi:NAD(P)-dependent dehydrogenase (short-subunit alcohol dehydrogenase family)
MDNLIALITGANKGIGKEIARQLAGAGLTVYVGSRDAERGQRAVDEIGGDARPLVLDVTDETTINEAARQIAAYRSSKTALNALTVFYAHSLADDKIKVNAHAPGLRRTDLNAGASGSDGDPAEGAAGAVRLALLPDDGPSGEFFNWDGTPVPW